MDFNDQCQFRNKVSFLVDPTIFGDNINVAIPNVSNRKVFICSYSAPTTITNFTGAINNKTIRILGDGNATVKNGTNIFTNTGADKLLEVNKIYVFTMINNLWYEDAS